MFRDSAEKNRNQTIIEPYIHANYNLEILGQKWRALTNCLALRNHQNLVLGKNNQVSLAIGQILKTIADNTGWLQRNPQEPDTQNTKTKFWQETKSSCGGMGHLWRDNEGFL